MTDFKISEESKIAAFDAVGDRTRFKLLKLMQKNKDICVSELAEAVDITPAGASQHLKILEKSGILSRCRDGQRICYRLRNDEPFVDELLQLIEK